MVHLKLINTLWFPEGFSYAMQEMFCSAPKMQLHLSRPASALRKAAVKQPLRKSHGETVSRPPSASSCWAGWGRSGLFPERISVAGSEAEVFKVAWLLARAYASSTEMYFALSWLGPRKRLSHRCSSAYFCQSRAVEVGTTLTGKAAHWGAAGAVPHSGFAGDPTPPVPADQALSVSEVVSNSLQGGETEGFLEETWAWVWARSSKGPSVFPFLHWTKETQKWVMRLPKHIFTETTAFLSFPSQRHCIFAWINQ